MKRDKIIYWVVTTLFSLALIGSSIMYLTKNSTIVDGFKFLGYPEYLIPLLGTAKFLGALALVNPWSSTLKEWAYAGFTFNLIGAAWTHIATNSPATSVFVFLAVLAVSYIFFQRLKTRKASTVITESSLSRSNVVLNS
ncbi:MAG: DoxX family protein [Chitinophagaceae bacterium]|nr:DoxX family protein [Chitinophagaceae bacterium]